MVERGGRTTYKVNSNRWYFRFFFFNFLFLLLVCCWCISIESVWLCVAVAGRNLATSIGIHFRPTFVGFVFLLKRDQKEDFRGLLKTEDVIPASVSNLRCIIHPVYWSTVPYQRSLKVYLKLNKLNMHHFDWLFLHQIFDSNHRFIWKTNVPLCNLHIQKMFWRQYNENNNFDELNLFQSCI